MASATATPAVTGLIGGAPGQTLVACNRCHGKGIWVGPKSSGTCFACRGSGLLEQSRAERYLFGTVQHLQSPAQQALGLALEAKAKAEHLGWIMQDPVQLPDRVELLGRNPRQPGRTVHLTWVYESRTRYQEWLSGPPSQHKDLLAP
jgi:hypothetical protein